MREAHRRIADGHALLACEHSPRRERPSVPNPLDAILDRYVRASAAQEVRVQRVQGRIRRRSPRRDRRLPEHQPAEYAVPLWMLPLRPPDEAILVRELQL